MPFFREKNGRVTGSSIPALLRWDGGFPPVETTAVAESTKQNLLCYCNGTHSICAALADALPHCIAAHEQFASATQTQTSDVEL